MELAEKIKYHFNENIQTHIIAADTLVEVIKDAAKLIVSTLLNNNKILTCGNGGSTTHAQHLSEIMLNRLTVERPSLPIINLSNCPATITAIANDLHYSEIYSKQIEALGQENDLLVIFSPKGHAQNILEAVEIAHQRQMKIIAFTGCDGGEITTLLSLDKDIEIRSPSDNISRTQEVHLLLIHCLSDAIDQCLFSNETNND